MTVIVVGHVYRDNWARERLQTPLGPFTDRADAEAYMQSQKPLWGEWHVSELHAPLRMNLEKEVEKLEP